MNIRGRWSLTTAVAGGSGPVTGSLTTAVAGGSGPVTGSLTTAVASGSGPVTGSLTTAVASGSGPVTRVASKLPAYAVVAILVVAAPLFAGAVAQDASAALRSATKPCVGVIVDASRAGGAVRTGCARLDPPTGFAALRSAGFSFRLRPDGLICQIGNRPSGCVASTQRYWSYWHRAPGSSRWTYSNIGPGARNPKPGSTEAWVFQTGGGQAKPPSIRQATICPVAVRAAPTRARARASSATPSSATPTSARPTSSATKPGKTATTQKPLSPPASTAAASTSSTAVAEANNATPSPSPSTSSKEPGTSAAAAGAVRRGAGDGDSGGTLALLGALALITSIGVAALARARAPSRR